VFNPRISGRRPTTTLLRLGQKNPRTQPGKDFSTKEFAGSPGGEKPWEIVQAPAAGVISHLRLGRTQV
jgi:hypothetical protein